ncbi:MAG: hypothetical protein R3A44_30270 [Caldilineaceae bacterium]
MNGYVLGIGKPIGPYEADDFMGVATPEDVPWTRVGELGNSPDMGERYFVGRFSPIAQCAVTREVAAWTRRGELGNSPYVCIITT